MGTFLTQAYLMHKYGPRLDKRQLAEVLGISVGTVMNKASAGTLGVATYTEHGALWASAAAVAEHLDKLDEEARAKATPSRRAPRRSGAAATA